MDVAVSPDGWLWFTDRDGDRLRLISPFADAPELAAGTGAGDLTNPGGVAVGPEGNIVVADTNNDRLVFYDRFGNRLRTWGEGLLRRPDGVDITWHGDIVVADTGNDRIVFVNRLWKLVGTFGASGTGPGSFNGPADVAVDRHGRLWVTDRNNHRVQLFHLERRVD
jgi:DNA-binding beta-propeller fold protein YncE